MRSPLDLPFRPGSDTVPEVWADRTLVSVGTAAIYLYSLGMVLEYQPGFTGVSLRSDTIDV